MVDAIFGVYAVVATLFWLGLAIFLNYFRRKVMYLRDVTGGDTPASLPSVSIIIPVRNEEHTISEALRTVCNLEYPDYKVLVLNDRSTDGTAARLSAQMISSARLSVHQIDHLPEGWLGKNHAMYQGAMQSKSSWILFTDADVKFKPDTLTNAMRYVLEQRLDHLTVLPEVQSRSSILNAVLGTFVMMLELKTQPWKVSNPTSSASLGVGAFNLVRTETYMRAGTHKAIALRPDDDLKLAELLKKNGARAGVLYGEDQIWLEWYSSLSEFVSGLMKNTFSVFNYRLWFAILGGMLPVLLFYVMPPVLLLSNTSRIFFVVIFVSQFLIFLTNKGIQNRWWYFLTIPFAGVVMLWVTIKSTFLTLKNGGVYWRDTFYPLSELKKQR